MTMLTPWRCRATTALCLLLSACAAGRSGADGYTPVQVPDSGYGAFLAARYAEGQDDQAAAARFYAAALRADPGNAGIVQSGFQAGLLAGAPQAADLAAQLPDNPLAVMLRGNQAALAGQYDAAKQIFASLPQDDISGLVKPLLIAWMEFGEGNEQAALTGLTANGSGGSFGGVYGLNAALVADAAGDAAAAAPLYAGLDNSQPDLRLAQVMASWLARSGQADQAQAELDALMDAHPDLHTALPALQAQVGQKVISTPTQGLAEAYLTLAGTLDSAQAATLRTVFLRFALQLRPDLSAARLLLANSQVDADDPNYTPTDVQMRAALDTLSPIAKSDPLYAPAAVQEADILQALGAPDQGVALLEGLVAQQPDDAGLLGITADLLRGAGHDAEAKSYYTRAIAAAGQPAGENEWTLFFDRAICESDLNDWTSAEADVNASLKLSPDQPYVLNYLAYSWAEQGVKLAQAHAMLTRAVALDPDDGAVIDSLAYVELRQGEAKAALQDSLKAVHLQPDDPEINGHLGDAFWAVGEKLHAAYQWQRALSLKPDDKLKAEIEAKVAAHFGGGAP
jgi:tetratricopeptide (TPR) repeat protein